MEGGRCLGLPRAEQVVVILKQIPAATPSLPTAAEKLDPEAPEAGRAPRRRSWLRSALRAVLVLAACAGGLAGFVAWWLPDGELARNARSGGVGEAVDEVLRLGSAEPLAAHFRRHPGTHVCFVRQYGNLSGRPWPTHWRTWGLPNLSVPDGDWAIAVVRARRPPEWAVVSDERFFLLAGNLGCAAAERLRLDLEDRGGSFVLRPSARP